MEAAYYARLFYWLFLNIDSPGDRRAIIYGGTPMPVALRQQGVYIKEGWPEYLPGVDRGRRPRPPEG